MLHLMMNTTIVIDVIRVHGRTDERLYYMENSRILVDISLPNFTVSIINVAYDRSIVYYALWLLLSL